VSVHDEHKEHVADPATPGDEERATLSPGAGVSMHPATRQAVEDVKARHKAADAAARAKREAAN
jgi:hypothetical protein